ncbi:MAG: ATP-binding protein [Chloroflexia bacterium]|nr:ATP-binding protein [Chloroflexia bacterium]
MEDGKVNVFIKDDSQNITVIVEDTGIGMNHEDVEKLFNEFVRIKNEKTKNITGSGLGLSIVKKIVNLYNGDIKTESKEGKGTKFTITLPKQPLLNKSITN